MDALQLLRDDHRRVRELFRQFDEAHDASTRKALTDEAIAELMIHAQLEEEIFYPAMEREGMKDLIGHAEEEHHAAENLMNEIIDLDARDSQLEAKFTVLIDMVTEHVTEEESQIFPRAAEVGMERLQRIGDQLQELRMRMESTPASERRRPQQRTAAATMAREVSRAARAAGSGGRGGRARGSTQSKSRSGSGSKAARGQREKERSRKKTAKAGAGSSRSRGNGSMASMTKQELYERAQKADIEGRSSMSKSQLVRALQKSK